MRVLVTGGAGYIGSVVVEELLRDNHQVTVYDNLSKGHRQAVTSGADFVQAELLDRDRLKTELRQREIEGVIHMAADSLVGEAVIATRSVGMTVAQPFKAGTRSTNDINASRQRRDDTNAQQFHFVATRRIRCGANRCPRP